MKKLLFILFSWVVINGLSAQNNDGADMPVLLENKVWKVQLPQGKRYDMEMEFRDAIWRSGFWYDGKRKETLYSYSLCGDTIKVFESREKYIIQELTDSTLVFQYLPDTLTIGVGPVRCVTDNSLQGQWENENRLDSIWRKEDIWNKGVSPISKNRLKTGQLLSRHDGRNGIMTWKNISLPKWFIRNSYWKRTKPDIP